MKDFQFSQKLNLWQRIEKLYQQKLEFCSPQDKPVVEKWIFKTTTKVVSIQSQFYQENYEN